MFHLKIKQIKRMGLNCQSTVFLVDVRAEKDGTAGLPAHLPVLDAAGSHTQHDCHLR